MLPESTLEPDLGLGSVGVLLAALLIDWMIVRLHREQAAVMSPSGQR